ncbi:hypothetical protein Y1Q_0007642 [Alligator mississippiensis]|uniref:Uncharacterized protein n=1 Tax=Alligator mississippiensis TaxID=8496 RepID=A0A151NC41_ALLMI|nr:hypothetical protein Y1Q_0007642 [Alligator mississippiensis]
MVHLVHLEMHAESPLAHLAAAEGVLYHHVAPAQAVVGVLLPAVQLPHLRLHKPGQEWASQVLDNEGRDDNVTNDEIGDPGSVVPTLHQPGEWGVVEDVGIMGTSHPASKDMGQVALVVDNALQDDGEVAIS